MMDNGGIFSPQSESDRWQRGRRLRLRTHRPISLFQANKLAPLVPFLCVLSSRNSFDPGFHLVLAPYPKPEGPHPTPFSPLPWFCYPMVASRSLARLLPYLGLKTPPATSALRRPR